MPGPPCKATRLYRRVEEDALLNREDHLLGFVVLQQHFLVGVLGHRFHSRRRRRRHRLLLWW